METLFDATSSIATQTNIGHTLGFFDLIGSKGGGERVKMEKRKIFGKIFGGCSSS